MCKKKTLPCFAFFACIGRKDLAEAAMAKDAEELNQPSYEVTAACYQQSAGWCRASRGFLKVDKNKALIKTLLSFHVMNHSFLVTWTVSAFVPGDFILLRKKT